MDIAAFLGRYPPFDSLPRERLSLLAGRVQIEHFSAGSVILDREGDASRALYVVRKGAVELLDEARVIDLLGEGEVFGHLSLLSEASPTLTVRAHEDSLCYLIDPAAAQEILGTRAGQTFVISSVRRRVTALTEVAIPEGIGPRYRTLAALVRREPVMCEPETSVADAAQMMATHRVSCLLIRMRGGLGILTDRDLRTRVVAARVSADTPVADIATFPAVALTGATMAGEALIAMMAEGYHHFPVEDESGRIIGVVTDTDLMGLGRHTPFAIRSAIDRSADREAAIKAAEDLPQVVATLVGSGAEPVGVGRVASLVIDALTRKLLDLFMGLRGEPPVPWAWIALGSAARHEQALRTDQDHALAFDPGELQIDEIDPYFAEMAEFVTSGLESAGFPRCVGDAMAVHPSLRRSGEGWRQALQGWMNDPGVEGSILSSIVFDYRRVTGPFDIEPVFDEAVLSASSHPGYLRHLAHRALDKRPPTGFMRDLVVEHHGEHAGTLDVKHGGITLISNLARAAAISAGSTEKQTIARLRAAAKAGSFDAGVAGELEEAFRFLWGVRLTHQARQVRSSIPADDLVDPATLGPVTRRGLRESFRVIARAQRALATELGVRPP